MARTRSALATVVVVAGGALLAAVFGLFLVRGCLSLPLDSGPPLRPDLDVTLDSVELSAEQRAALEQPPGRITGVAVFAGTPVPPVRINMSASSTAAAATVDSPVFDPKFTINPDGTLPNAFVWIRAAPLVRAVARITDGARSPPVHLDAHLYMYRPYVFGLLRGQPLVVRNLDDETHCLNVTSRRNPRIAKTQAPGASDTIVFTKSARVRITCDCYSWMSAYCWVLDHPFFATTDAAGRFEIGGLPPDYYTIHAWHPGFGEGQAEVEVVSGETAAIGLSLAR